MTHDACAPAVPENPAAKKGSKREPTVLGSTSGPDGGLCGPKLSATQKILSDQPSVAWQDVQTLADTLLPWDHSWFLLHWGPPPSGISPPPFLFQDGLGPGGRRDGWMEVTPAGASIHPLFSGDPGTLACSPCLAFVSHSIPARLMHPRLKPSLAPTVTWLLTSLNLVWGPSTWYPLHPWTLSASCPASTWGSCHGCGPAPHAPCLQTESESPIR